jgi:cysteine-rich repeat protein
MIARTLLVALAVASIAACGGDEERKKGFSGTGATGNGGTGGSGNGGTGGGVGGASGAGTGGVSGGGTGGTGGAPTDCGNGRLDPEEECDGTNLNQKTCADYGFITGNLVCLPSCKLDTSQCGGIEHCADNIDNDNDGAPDCVDSDCTAKCAAACDTPIPIPDPATVGGSTDGHADSVQASCGGSGPDVAYAVTVAKAGVFEAILGSTDPVSVSIRTSCGSGASELACTSGKRISIPVAAGTQLFVIVDGTQAGTPATYGLNIQSRAVVCGDTHKDDPEVCDDGNTDAGDGCSPTCSLEATEGEPNDTTGQANPFDPLFFGLISGATDVDVMQIDVAQANATVSLAILDLGDGSCENDELDSLVELRASDGSLVNSDDDSGEGKCSNLSETGLAAGTYYAVVKAAPGANPASFAYKLFVDVQ